MPRTLEPPTTSGFIVCASTIEASMIVETGVEARKGDHRTSLPHLELPVEADVILPFRERVSALLGSLSSFVKFPVSCDGDSWCVST